MTTPPYTEALERALGQVLGRARGELDLLKAQSDAVLAGLGAKVAEAEARLSGLDAQIRERLEALKDGEPGAPGERGEPGLQGERGPPGLDDVDTELSEDGAVLLLKFTVGDTQFIHDVPLPAGPQGHPGEKGADGEAGRDGVDGESGKDGAEGSPGEPGADGADGRDGDPGRDGADGEVGPQGEPGRDGKDGSPGEQGERGAEGAPGKLQSVAEWSEGVHYEGDCRTHDGELYQAVRDTGQVPGGPDWIKLAAKGAAGKDGREHRHLGTWAPDGEYEALNVVALNGASFVAKNDNPGPCPGDGWQLMAAQGKRGQPGERGAQGERGGPGPAVVDIHLDEYGVVTLVNADGSRIERDWSPILSRLQS